MEHFYRFLTRAVCCATIKAISYRIHGGSFYMNKKGFAVYKGKTVLREMLYKGKPNKNYQTVLNTDKLFQ